MLDRVKSAAELEEDMLAKMSKFKARPLPKKVTILKCYALFFLSPENQYS
jgi:hypothetical protein